LRDKWVLIELIERTSRSFGIGLIVFPPFEQEKEKKYQANIPNIPHPPWIQSEKL
jgi:hypothetical protein